MGLLIQQGPTRPTHFLEASQRLAHCLLQLFCGQKQCIVGFWMPCYELWPQAALSLPHSSFLVLHFCHIFAMHHLSSSFPVCVSYLLIVFPHQYPASFFLRGKGFYMYYFQFFPCFIDIHAQIHLSPRKYRLFSWTTSNFRN
uniref:Uncharacterized protein n=1 Tax=Salix viminalis TaxID=40686 RepID=A0A6N2KZ17_SALVM